MAEGTWKKDVKYKYPSSSWSSFIRGDQSLGYIYIPDGCDLYRAQVFPDGPLRDSETVADNVSEAEAKAAVEEYWVDKEPPA